MNDRGQISNEGMLRRLRHLFWTIECGMHSGIPPCYVRFYVMHWMFSTEDSRFRSDHRRLMRRLPGSLSYIACPFCCKDGHVVVLKPCPDPDIPCDHAEEQAP